MTTDKALSIKIPLKAIIRDIIVYRTEVPVWLYQELASS